jgi:hypothetical protein
MEARACNSLHLLRVLMLVCVSLCVTSIAHAQTVNLAWDANTEPNLAGYVVYYGVTSGVYPHSIDVGMVTAKTVTTNLIPGTRFYFIVKAYDSTWRLSSASNEVSVVTSGTPPTNPPPTDPPPTLPAPTLTTLSPTSGPKAGGTLVTLTGTNFVSGAKVYFGGVLSPSIQFVSAAQLKATTPKGSSGSQAVTVVNPSGQSAVKSNAFTFTGPKPKITTSAPTTGSISGGTELRISGEEITTDVGVLIGGQPATQVTHLDGNSLLAIAPPRSAAGLVDVSLVEAGQVQSTLSGAFRYQQVTSPDDTDGDGLPNMWEEQWGLNPNSTEGVDGAAGDPDGDLVLNIDEKNAGSHPRGFVKRYFAEGVVNGFFDTRFALANPQNQPARVLLEFLDIDGQTSQQIMLLPARSRTTVVARDVTALPGKSFATLIESDQVIVADRLMRWEATFYGSHAETAITEPSTTWYFAEGATSGPYELYYLLQNPTEQVADVDVRFLRPNGAAPVTRSYQLAPKSRTNIYVDNDIPELAESEVSAQFTSNNVPIIAERSMYFNARLPFFGGHGSAGVTAPAKQWFLAEGATGSFFSMFVLIANPTNEDASVKVTYLLDSGAPIVRTYPVPANSRYNVYVNGEPGLANTTMASRYESNVPIIVERTMWWPGDPTRWTEGHNSFGVTSTGTSWALAEGESGGPQNTSTFILVANTSAFAGEAKVTLLIEGAAEVSRTISRPANSRVTVPMDGPFEAAMGKRFSTLVESLGATPAQIVIERAMYSDSRGDSWGAGSNAVGTKLQ